jgi:hypothetical protein
MARDDFSEDVIRKLGDRVGWLCSRAECRAPTKGPHTQNDKAINIGCASHIRAASLGGPRYDTNQTPEQRKSIENAIWLCRTCGTLIDSDESRFPSSLLLIWKIDAEQRALELLSTNSTTTETCNKNIEVLNLIKKIQSQSIALSQCIAEAISLSIKIKNKNLEEFCKKELIGWKEPTSKSQQPTHRLVDTYISFSEIDMMFPWGSEYNIWSYMQNNKNTFIPHKLIIGQSIAELEKESISKKTTITISPTNFKQLSNLNDAPDQQCYVYSRSDSHKTVIESIRSELTKILLSII